MIKENLLTAILILISLAGFSQKNVNSMVVVSYYVENLFDIVNSPQFEDDAFTPEGSYNYRGTWNMLDQFIVSYNMINQEKGLTTGFEQGNVFSEEWMMYDNEKYGGPSDLLPIYVTFSW
jgi:hypothetical protein